MNQTLGTSEIRIELKLLITETGVMNMSMYTIDVVSCFLSFASFKLLEPLNNNYSI